MFVILRLAAALKSQYSISPVTRAKKISQQKTPFTDTGSRGRNEKTKSTKRQGKREEEI